MVKQWAVLPIVLMNNGRAILQTGELEEGVWVMSPRGIPGQTPRRYKLHKALYGLKQAHLAWHSKLVKDLQHLGFGELPSAPCVFMRQEIKTKMGAQDASEHISTFILVYVDDLLILAPSAGLLKSTLASLHALYDMRQMDDVDMFLGVQLTWSKHRQSLHMSQPRYALDMVKRYGLQDAKPASTPMVASFFSGLDTEQDKSVVDVEAYRSMVGSLLFLAGRSRPDITIAVAILARFSHAPTAYCMRAVQRVLRYVHTTRYMGVTMSVGNAQVGNSGTRIHGKDIQVNGFVDSDYAGDTVDRKSTSGFMVKINDAPCIWASKKQIAVALSTCEAEYHAMTIAAKDVLWLQRVLAESRMMHDCGMSVPVLRSDNQSAIAWCTGERLPQSRAKHVDVRVHFIRNLTSQGKVHVHYVETTKNDADMLTKPLGPIELRAALHRIGICETGKKAHESDS